MELLCHRCGGTLVPHDPFCPNCGAPQLRIEEGAEGVEPFDAARADQPGKEGREASWRDAILAGLVFSIPVGLLSSNLLPLASGLCLWVVAGSVAAVNLYRRRAALALLNTRVGIRIGMVLGLAAALLCSTANGAMMVLERYALHRGGQPDKEVEILIAALMASYAQNPNSQATMPGFPAALISPEGRAAAMLFATFAWAASIFLFSVIGGALGAKVFSVRRMMMKNR
ncbi:MAG TPA: hypothetical protein VGD59_06435 [Acidisarcina sp.]